MKKILALAFIFCLFTPRAFAQTTVQSADGVQVTIQDTSRIISIGSSITETVFALGAGNQVVAVDVSSTYPPEVNTLPKVPYVRRLSAGGILSLHPSLILASEAASPKTAIKQLRAAGVPVVLIPMESSVEGAITKIKRLAKALGKREKAQKLIAHIQKKMRKVKKLKQKASNHPKVMFILSVGHGAPTIAGKNTEAAKMIKLAGGQNAFTSFEGYKAVNTGAIAAANPDIILIMGNRLKDDSAVERIKQMPGISLTNAAQQDRLFVYDGTYLIGFGPRTGDAVLELVKLFHPDLKANP